MKSKLLHFSLFVFILGFAGILAASVWIGGISSGSSEKQDVSVIKDANEYLTKIRSNQVTGKINPNDVLAARDQAQQMHFKSGNALGLDWEEMGPENAPGRVRAVIYDNTDPSGNTLFTAGVTGGIWETNNFGTSWHMVDLENRNLYVTCLVQTSDGTIYAGTGEGFCTDDETYYGGLVGQGLFKSTDKDNFTLVEGTKPTVTANNDTVDWAYINQIAVDPTSSRIYVATNTGLFYSNDGNSNWTRVEKHYLDTVSYNVSLSIDSTVRCNSWEFVGNKLVLNQPQYNTAIIDTTSYEKIAQPKIRNIVDFEKINCTDVDVAADGTVVATFGNMVYTAPGGSDLIFTNRSGRPNNPKVIAREIRAYQTTLIAIDTSNNVGERTVSFDQTTNWANDVVKVPSPLSANPNRAQVSFAPSDASGNIIYAVCTQQYGFLENIYLSEDKGETWRIIFPGGSSLVPFNGTSCFNNVLTVFPLDPYKILVGGEDMWLGQRIYETGYFDWSNGPITSGFFFEGYPLYLPTGHHSYVFAPGSNSRLTVATSNGVYTGSIVDNEPNFGPMNKVLAITQSYTVGVGGTSHSIITGTQGNGVQYISGLTNRPNEAYQILGGNGGSSFISVINPEAFIYSNSGGTIVRSEDMGQNTSFNFGPPTSNLFLTPMAMWEEFHSDYSRDSVTFKPTKTYYQGETLLCRSLNRGFSTDIGYPFTYVLEQDSLVAGDSIRVKDIIQSKLFLATHDSLFMTKDAVKFAKDCDWWSIADLTGNATCIAYSKDANYVFVGMDNGILYRVSNIALAYNRERAHAKSPYCIIATDQLQIPQFAGRFITSVSVDPENAENVLVTLGNYGNESYVFRSTNALDSLSVATFTDITGNLPKMPVYSSMIEMKNSNIAIIGTEYGVYTTDNLQDSEVVWTVENQGIGTIPVFQIKQQTVYKAGYIIESDDPEVADIVFPSVENYGDIYIATYGRGIFRDNSYMTVGIEENKPNATSNTSKVNVYPNPVERYANVMFELPANQNVTISIFDLSGRLIKSENMNNLSKGKNEIRVDCSSWNTGAYIVSIQYGSQIHSSKFLVK